MAITNSNKDKYKLFLNEYKKSGGSIALSCLASGLEEMEALDFLKNMKEEEYKQKFKQGKTNEIGSKDWLINEYINELSKKDLSIEAKVKVGAEFSKLMGYYDDTTDLAYLEEMKSLSEKICSVFPTKILASIGYDLEEYEELNGGVIEENISDSEDINIEVK